MQPYIKLETDTTPEVRFVPEESLWRIAGQSYPADVATFYEPILLWVESLAESGQTVRAKLQVEISYINSSSEKYLFYLLYKLQDLNARGSQISIEWIYDPEDEVIEALGDEYTEELPGIPFHKLALQSA